MEHDVIILGGGPAGYLAADRLGRQGLKVLLVEKQFLGGTCLNVGCVPTKTLLNGAKLYAHSRDAADYGVKVEGVSYDWSAMQGWKDEVVGKLCAGVAALMKKRKVQVVEGEGVLTAPNTVLVTPAGGGATREFRARATLVATGSVPAMPPIPGLRDNPLVVDSTGLLALPSVPRRLCVIGGGVIGVEFASLFASLGVEVTVVEMLDEIIPFMDREQTPLLRRALMTAGIKFNLGCRVERIEGSTTFFKTAKGTEEKVEADLVLMAIGRRAARQGWGAETIGLDFAPQGIVVDERMRTNLPGVWAAGDITGRSMLAHTAYRMGEVAAADIAATLAGDPAANRDHMRYNAIPWVLYSLPEAAGVGLTEDEARKRGYEIRKASVPGVLSGRFVAENGFRAKGALKLIADAASDRILGVHIVGPYASEIIWGAAALIEQEMRVSDLREMIVPHPTVSELIREAAWELA